MDNNINRRRFLTNVAIGTAGIGYVVSSCKSKRLGELTLPPLLETAPEGKILRAGLIGCGGRGTGAAINFLDAGPALEIVALADVFEDKLTSCRTKLKKEKNIELKDENCFLGFDAYKKLIEQDLDVVILATPPYFRPEHFKAAIEARKHVFMEKPVAVDPVGARDVIATARKAETAGLSVVTGTQRRHQRDYIETIKKVYEGTIGKLVAANCYWNQHKLWHRDWKEDRTDMENMLRDWVNWSWLSGDHIVEQHIHNIDVVNWFMNKFPVRAVGFGSRQRRLTGDQYDNFSVDFVYDDEVHMHSMCRQINGCSTNVSEFVRGAEGYTNCRNVIYDSKGTEIWKYEYPVNEDTGEVETHVKISPYVQEHIDLVTAIRTNKPINEAERTAKTNLTAIMGRISAYTGNEVTWEEMMQSDLKLGPEKIEMGPVKKSFPVPVPGTSPEEA